jgi:hypothetical protein
LIPQILWRQDEKAQIGDFFYGCQYIFLSCHTTFSYNRPNDYIESRQAGIIAVYFVSRQSSNPADIVVSGRLEGFSLGTFFPSDDSRRRVWSRRWSGSVIVAGKESLLKIQGLMSQGNSALEIEMLGIKVKRASKVYQFPKFDIPCGIPLFADYIPERLTQLSVKGKKLIIEFGELAYNKFAMLIAENSKLFIKDEYGNIYADFDRYSYRTTSCHLAFQLSCYKW